MVGCEISVVSALGGVGDAEAGLVSVSGEVC